MDSERDKTIGVTYDYFMPIVIETYLVILFISPYFIDSNMKNNTINERTITTFKKKAERRTIMIFKCNSIAMAFIFCVLSDTRSYTM